jgi:hypothetical protein
MANKLTKEKLKLLIEQVLQEKQKTDYPFDAKSEFQDIFGNNYRKAKKSLGGEPELKTKINDLAKQDGLKDKVAADDFDELPPSGGAYDAALAIKKHGRSQKVKNVAAGMKIKLTRAQKDQLDQDIKTSYPNSQAKQDVAKSIPDTDLDYFAARSESDTNYKQFKPKGYLASSTADVFESFFQGNKANTVEKRIEALSVFSQDVLKAANGDKTDLQSRGAQQIMNDAIVVKALAKISRELQGSAGGFQFETFLAVLLSGVITGGSGAAADLGIQGRPIYISAKFKAGGAGSQSANNVFNELKEAGTIWYITGFKKEGVANLGKATQLDIHISGVQLFKNDPRQGDAFLTQQFDWIKKDGTQISDYSDRKAKKKIKNPKKSGAAEQLGVQYDPTPDYTIVLGGPEFYAQGGQSFDELFISAVNNLDVAIKDAVKEMSSVYQSSDKITQKMKSYVGKSDINAGIEVKNTYMAMLGTLNNVFSKITDTKKAKVGQIKGTLSENKKNKTKSLKDLDKLIEHVILNKMNK